MFNDADFLAQFPLVTLVLASAVVSACAEGAVGDSATTATGGSAGAAGGATGGAGAAHSTSSAPRSHVSSEGRDSPS